MARLSGWGRDTWGSGPWGIDPAHAVITPLAVTAPSSSPAPTVRTQSVIAVPTPMTSTTVPTALPAVTSVITRVVATPTALVAGDATSDLIINDVYEFKIPLATASSAEPVPLFIERIAARLDAGTAAVSSSVALVAVKPQVSVFVTPPTTRLPALGSTPEVKGRGVPMHATFVTSHQYQSELSGRSISREMTAEESE